MAQSWKAKRLAHERAMNDRLQREITALADPITRLIVRAATETNADGAAVLPDNRQTRSTLSTAVWGEVIKPYFIGPGINPLDGAVPQSPFMRLIVDGIRGAITIQAEQQVSIIHRLASPMVRDWLTGPRPFNQRELRAPHVIREQGGSGRKPWYDPFHTFVSPNGYRLSDNGWRTSIETRRAIDNLVEQGITNGTSAVDLAKQLEGYLWPEAARVRTRTPYGSDGSYWARRLARTEITAAAGRSMVNASLINPYVEGLKWNLSGSHPDVDICDDNAHGGENGDGVYAKDNFPQYPAHPHELCYITAEVTSSPESINRQWEAQITARTPEAVAVRGAFDLDWLINALVYGWIINTIFDVVNLERLAA